MKEFISVFFSSFLGFLVYNWLTIIVLSINFNKLMKKEFNNWSPYKKGCYKVYVKKIEYINNYKIKFDFETNKLLFSNFFLYKKGLNKLNELKKNLRFADSKINFLSMNDELKSMINVKLFENRFKEKTDEYNDTLKSVLTDFIIQKLYIRNILIKPNWYIDEEFDSRIIDEEFNQKLNNELKIILYDINNY